MSTFTEIRKLHTYGKYYIIICSKACVTVVTLIGRADIIIIIWAGYGIGETSLVELQYGGEYSIWGDMKRSGKVWGGWVIDLGWGSWVRLSSLSLVCGGVLTLTFRWGGVRVEGCWEGDLNKRLFVNYSSSEHFNCMTPFLKISHPFFWCAICGVGEGHDAPVPSEKLARSTFDRKTHVFDNFSRFCQSARYRRYTR